MTQGGKRCISRALCGALLAVAGVAFVMPSVATDPSVVEEKQPKESADADSDEPAQQVAPQSKDDAQSSAVAPASVSTGAKTTPVSPVTDRDGGWVLFTVVSVIAAGGAGFAAWWLRAGGAAADQSSRLVAPPISTESVTPSSRRRRALHPSQRRTRS